MSKKPARLETSLRRHVLKEYRVDCVRRLDQTFGTLTKMILGGGNPDDFPAAEAGTNIYMEVA